MVRFYFEKLVRDNIVESCESDPKVLHTAWRTLDDVEYRRELVKKVFEEADEVPETNEDADEVLNELSDLQAVVDALRESAGFTAEQVRSVAADKAAQKGGFALRHYIDYVDLAEDSKWIKTFRSQPDKYRETREEPIPERGNILPEPNLPLGKYRHYKGGEYEVLTLACDEATHEWLVVYRALYDTGDAPKVWVRTYINFTEPVDAGGRKVARFTALQ